MISSSEHLNNLTSSINLAREDFQNYRNFKMQAIRSSEIHEIMPALCVSQSKFPVLQKRTQAYGYKYADYAEIKECIGPILSFNNLYTTSEVDWEKNLLTMYVYHSSGQFIGTSVKLHYKAGDKVNEMQAMGSALSYAKRYAISLLFDLAADKESDDDGHKSSPKWEFKDSEKPKASPAPTVFLTPMSETQCAELDSLLEEDADKDWVKREVCARKGLTTIYEIDSIYYESELKRWLKNRKAKVLEKKQ